MTQLDSVNSRYAFADYAKVAGTLLVVFGHLIHPYDTLSVFIYSFHMPLFFFISGLFYKVCSFSDEIWKTANRLFIPTLIYLTISLVYIGCRYSEFTFISLLRTSIYGIFKGETILVNPICWFLLSLINLRILTNFWFNMKWLSVILLFLGFFSFYNNFFFIAQTQLAFPYFLLGCYLKEFIIRESKKNCTMRRNFIFPFLLFGICALIVFFNGRMNMGLRLFGTLPYGFNVILYFISGLSGTIGFIYFSFLFKKNNKYIYSASNSLLTCVGLQFLFFESFTHYYSYWICIIISVSIVLACVFIHKTLSYVLPHYFR